LFIVVGMQDYAAELGANLGGWNNAMGMKLVRVTAEECVAEFTVEPQHLQPYGIVHGGVHCGIIEAACSTGAAVFALARNQTVVGLENSTSFVTAARGGKLTVRATPVTRGRKTQVWEARVTDEAGKICATGRVRLLCLEPGEALAGRTAAVEPTK
jgi:uncharacterized protein (TIGR00369 family)